MAGVGPVKLRSAHFSTRVRGARWEALLEIGPLLEIGVWGARRVVPLRDQSNERDRRAERSEAQAGVEVASPWR